VAEACLTFEEWACRAGGLFRNRPPIAEKSADTVLVHAHCHQKALVGTGPVLRLLGSVPGCEPIDLDAGCCGMAGSFGYEREHYDLSRAVGERKLFPAVRAASQTAVVIASGFSCRNQLQHFTGRTAVHPAVFLDKRFANKPPESR
jgi:Fe-S oxidoreductase